MFVFLHIFSSNEGQFTLSQYRNDDRLILHMSYRRLLFNSGNALNCDICL